jgi:hypothetical protein
MTDVPRKPRIATVVVTLNLPPSTTARDMCAYIEDEIKASFGGVRVNYGSARMIRFKGIGSGPLLVEAVDNIQASQAEAFGNPARTAK